MEFTDMPLVSQSNPGSENYGRQKKNVKPEITWSQLHCRFTPGFEDLLELGVTNGWYDTNRPLDV